MAIGLTFAEETTNPYYADDRNFYKVERWSKDEQHIVELLFAGNNLGKARVIFDPAMEIGMFNRDRRRPCTPA